MKTKIKKKNLENQENCLEKQKQKKWRNKTNNNNNNISTVTKQRTSVATYEYIHNENSAA